jgi:uncharacterized protein YkwD
MLRHAPSKAAAVAAFFVLSQGCASGEGHNIVIDNGAVPTGGAPATAAPSAPGTFVFTADAGDDDLDAFTGDARTDAPPDLDGGPADPDGVPTAPPTAPPTGPATEPPAQDDYEFCVSETNRFRAQAGQPPVARAQALEAFATEGAREDHESATPHGHFQRTGGGGVAFAENACPGWLGWFVQGSVQATVANCLAAFYSEGPGGGHYDNMMGPYATVGCGWYIDANESITIVQNFGR